MKKYLKSFYDKWVEFDHSSPMNGYLTHGAFVGLFLVGLFYSETLAVVGFVLGVFRLVIGPKFLADSVGDDAS